MKNFVMDGEVVTMAAPYDLANGEAVQVGSVFGVASKAAKLGEQVDLATVGVFDLVAESTQSYLPGTELFWDVANKRITSVSGVGSCVAVCIAPKAGGEAVVRGKLAPVFKGLVGDPAGIAAVRGAAGQAVSLLIVDIGDSITQGAAYRNPLPEAGAGYFYAQQPAGDNYLLAAWPSVNCAAGVPYSVKFDGVSSISVSVNGDAYGTPVDVTGGGHHAATSGTGSTILLGTRWRLRPSVATTWNLTNTSNATKALDKHFAMDLFGGMTAAAGMAHQKILNYGIGGDQPEDILNRVGQVIALKPDLVRYMCGINSIAAGRTDTAAMNLAVIDKIVAAGIRVLYVPTPPSGTLTAPQAVQWAESSRDLEDSLRKNYPGQVIILEAVPQAINPLGSSGTGLINADQFAVDNLHLHAPALLGKTASIGAAALTRLYPNAGSIRRVNAADAWSAQHPRGNFLGPNAAGGGTGGGLAVGSTGQLPTGWTETAYAGMMAAVYTAAQSGSPIPRTDNRNGYWTRGVYTNSSGAQATRSISIPLWAFPQGSQYFRQGLTLKFTNVTGLTGVSIFFALTGGTNGAGPWPGLLQTGGSAPLATATLNSQELYLVSQPFKVRADATGGAFYIQFTFANGGGGTIDMADPFIEAVF